MCENNCNMKEKGENLLKLRQDNAGENKILVKQLKCNDRKLNKEA